MHDPRLIELGILPDAAALDEAYRSFAREFLIELARPALDQPGQARRLIGNYLLAAGGGLKLKKVGDRTVCRLLDGDKMRSQIGVLARRIEDLARHPNRDQVSAFVAQYMAPPDRALMDEIARQLNQAGAFAEVAFVMPLVEADFNPMGGVKDVRLQKPASFEQEMLLWGGHELPAQKGKKKQKN